MTGGPDTIKDILSTAVACVVVSIMLSTAWETTFDRPMSIPTAILWVCLFKVFSIAFRPCIHVTTFTPVSRKEIEEANQQQVEE